MERLLQHGETSEIIPYNVDSPLILFPIRHHSPVCSYHLIKAIEAYRPDVILIEGPENANHLISVLTDEKTVLPSAFYYFYKDKKKLVSEEGADYKCYYPFQYSSPEYNALLQAKKLGITALFIDLPYSEVLINTAENQGLRKTADKHSYIDDSHIIKSRFYEKICEKTGTVSFEEFWEKYFEIGGLYISTEKFIRQMNTYCILTRADCTEEELESDSTLSRERYMAYNIQQAMSAHKKVLAVTGGFHTHGIYQLLQKGNIKPPKVHKIPDTNQGCYPMAYSYRASDALRGYASGMRYPYFYDRIIQELRTRQSPSEVYNEQVFDFVAQTARKSTEKDVQITIADMTSAYSMMNGLSALRGARECGITEAFDSVTACFIKGEKTLSSSLPLDILAQLATGDGIGHIGDTEHIPPLVADFEQQCRKLRIKCDTAVPVTVEASLFTSAKGLETSRFMHRMAFLETGFAELVKGPDIRRNKDRSRVREEWKCRRSPEVDASLTDHTTDGFTIEEACSTFAEKLLKQYQRCETAGGIAVDCFLMGITLKAPEMALIDDIVNTDGDFFSLGKGLNFFQTLCELQSLYNFNDSSAIKYMCRCFDRLLSMIPLMADIPHEKADDVINILKIMYGITVSELPDRTADFESALLTLADSDKKEPAVFGGAMGLLWAVSQKHKQSAENGAKGYLMGSTEIQKQGAEYLRGLFSTARDIVLLDNSFLEMTDRLITGMEYDDFIEILPSLRLAFSNFTPSEIQLASKAVAGLHGISGKDLLNKSVVDENLFDFGEKLDSIICGIIGKEALLYE
ncbi:MAG: DUF5682 family protein [Ruminococcus flavefaciens]|nr:DUF5682 family protein [Ruminococcus flavefaciens]MCM1229874.1 DUF5682 family protein [Ruminococcus flavefaciens]